MGKQSRRGNGQKNNKKKSKEDHKRDLQERQQRKKEQERQRLVEQQEDKEDGNMMIDEWTLMEGDRVWITGKHSGISFDENNPDTYRGVLTSLDDTVAHVRPFFFPENAQPVSLPAKNIFRDVGGLTLDHKVGDAVYCYTQDGWCPGIVTHLWPVWGRWDTRNANLTYKCNVFEKDGSTTEALPSVEARPLSCRFGVGDQVRVSVDRVTWKDGRSPTMHKGSSYVVCEVTAAMNASGCAGGDYKLCAVYECVVLPLKAKQPSCLVRCDTDEYTTSVHRSARERLFDSIRQDCSFDHISALITSSRLDVHVFEDLVLLESIKHGSFGMLLWIQKNLSLELTSVCDQAGNYVQHQLALSEHAVRFFKKLDDSLDIFKTEPLRLNTHRESFLDILVKVGNDRALDILFSPGGGLFRMAAIYNIRDEHIERLLSSAIAPSTKLIIKTFMHHNRLHLQRIRLHHSTAKTEEALLEQLNCHSFLLRPERIIRYAHQFDDSYDLFHRTVEEDILLLGMKGFDGIFRQFFELNKNALLATTTSYTSQDTQNELVQTELYGVDFDTNTVYEELDIVTIIARGPSGGHYPYYRQGASEYLASLRRYVYLNYSTSLLRYLKKELTETKKRVKGDNMLEYQVRIFGHKIHQLEDDDSLPKRLTLLELLVSHENQDPPNALDAIRFRQCGVLRWLVRHNSLDLNSMAASERMLTTPRARRMKFLDSRKIPTSLLTVSFLCFSAIEYDDLQSLEWIIEETGLSLESVVVYGFNLVHACAFFGRLEITIWLASRSCWAALAEQPSRRRTFEHAFAPHIAVAQGHTLSADILLKLGAPSMDGNKRNCAYYARRSPHQFVQDWAEKFTEERGPLQLEHDCMKLLKILRNKHVARAKAHVASTRCLEIRRWLDCGFHSFDEVLPCGKTYEHLLNESLDCSIQNEEFVLWLCSLVSRIYFREELETCTRKNFQDAREFWKNEPFYVREECVPVVDCIKLAALFSAVNDLELCGWLQRADARDFTFPDPDYLNPLLCHRILPDALALQFRAKLLRFQVCNEFVSHTRVQLCNSLRSGADPSAVEAEISFFIAVSVRLAEEENIAITEYQNARGRTDDVVQLNGQRLVNMQYSLLTGPDSYYKKSHPARRQLHLRGCSHFKIFSLFRVLAIENHSELTKWCLTRARNWTAEMELDMMRIAAFLENTQVVLVLSGHESDHNFLSTREERSFARLLGTAEAGLAEDFLRLLALMNPLSINDPLLALNTEDIETDEDYDKHVEKQKVVLASSLTVAVAYGFLAYEAGDSESAGRDAVSKHRFERIMHHMVTTSIASADSFFDAAFFILAGSRSYGARWEHLIDFTTILKDKLNFKVGSLASQSKLILASSKLFETLKWRDDRELVEVGGRWLMVLVSWGVDIQSLKVDSHEKARETLQSMQLEQRNSWSKFDVVKTNQPLESLKNDFRLGTLTLSGRDKGGLTVVHLAAAYDRVDVLQWLVEEVKADMNSQDAQGRTVLEVSHDSQAQNANRWIKTRKARIVISAFLSTHFHRRLAVQRKQKLLRGVVALQSRCRSAVVRRTFRERLISRMGAAQQFRTTWGFVIDMLSGSFDSHLNWSALREKLIDMRTTSENTLNEMLATGKILENATTGALVEEVGDDPTQDSFEEAGSCVASSTDASIKPSLAKDTAVLISSFVTKWLKQCDPKFKEFFMRRLQQLQNGDRSRILAKRLKGSRSTIFETYLEQKSGHRILWTERTGVREILIWCVAKHKAVSRWMKLIDESVSRGLRQRIPTKNFDPCLNPHNLDIENEVVLNPLGNVPLKMYEIQFDELEEAIVDDTWVPRLYLSQEERSIVETRGTLLLLGRSGTGKTICICNRMELDRLRCSHEATFKQLFVARSKRLQKYVKEAVGHHDCASYHVFDEVVKMLEARLPKLRSSDPHGLIFLPSQRMTFVKFKSLIYSDSSTSVAPLVVWTCIRSFLKGSIEALLDPARVLPRDMFMALGKKRCRISQDLRKSVYDIFEKYQRVTHELRMWDDCDRMVALLERLDLAMTSHLDLFYDIRKSKIYVDEVQDYMQIEILLFFKLSSPGALFLAGDPAQSVVEGVEFRFEDVRSVGYYIADLDGHGQHQRHLIPQKPMTVNVNFRSHSGILNVAASVLRCLFRVFPDSGQQLKEDRGVFAGPRPGVMYNLDPKLLADLLSEKLNGAVILTHDAVVAHWKQRLGYPLVYGIREAKGLEFKNVVLLDFFTEITLVLQKPWRDMLLGREGAASYVELEGQLKLLYTGVTRCIERLFVVETRKSVAGDAMTRWLTTTSLGSTTVGSNEALATKNNVQNIEAMALTTDEWTLSGIENAELAENSEDPEESIAFLDRAVFCFEQAKNSKLGQRARAHRSSVFFRLKVAQMDNSMESHESERLEGGAARLMKQLLGERLGAEASMLGHTILPILSESTQEKFQSSIFCKLDTEPQ